MADSSERLTRDEDGWTALDWAAGRGDEPETRRLLRDGADPLGTTPDGRTPYQIALAAGHRETARVLREAEQAAGQEPGGYRWRPYCRGYLLGDLRRFPGWREPQAGAEPELADDTVVYLHDDLTVTRGAWPAEDVLFGGSSDGGQDGDGGRDGDGGAWAAYCRASLGFTVPDHLDLVPPSSGDPVGAG